MIVIWQVFVLMTSLEITFMQTKVKSTSFETKFTFWKMTHQWVTEAFIEGKEEKLFICNFFGGIFMSIQPRSIWSDYTEIETENLLGLPNDAYS